MTDDTVITKESAEGPGGAPGGNQGEAPEKSDGDNGNGETPEKPENDNTDGDSTSTDSTESDSTDTESNKRTVKQKVPQMTVQPRRNQTVTAQMEMIRDRSRRSQTEITETIRPQAATRVVLRTVIIPRVRPSNSPIFRKVTS